MTFSIECLYCGKQWNEQFFYKETLKDLRCSDCKDRNLKIKELKLEDRDPFGYNYEDKKRVSKT